MNFWDVHGVWFLLAAAFFPRLTCLFLVTTPFGWLAWLGWVFWPSLLVAILAIPFWDTNPILVTVAWVWCFGKEERRLTK